MGVSIDGQLNYGIDFGDECKFPWSDEKYENDIEEWWISVGFNGISGNPFTEEGEYKEGFSGDDPRVDAWYDKKRAWMEENPVPIDDVWHCSYDYSMHILAVKGKAFRACRGDAVAITDMAVSDEEVKVFKDFLVKFNIETEEEPAWLLTSMWG